VFPLLFPATALSSARVLTLHHGWQDTNPNKEPAARQALHLV